MNWTSPQNSDARHPHSAKRKSMSRKNEAGDGWVLSVLMDCHGDRGGGGGGSGKRTREASLRKIPLFFQIYLHKLKCRQFTMAQWVSEKATCMGSSLHFHVFLQRVVLAPCLLKRRKYPFHSPWPHNIYSQDALYSCQSQIIRELVSCLMVQDCVTVQLMYAQNVNHFEQNAVHWCPWM